MPVYLFKSPQAITYYLPYKFLILTVEQNPTFEVFDDYFVSHCSASSACSTPYIIFFFLNQPHLLSSVFYSLILSSLLDSDLLFSALHLEVADRWTSCFFFLVFWVCCWDLINVIFFSGLWWIWKHAAGIWFCRKRERDSVWERKQHWGWNGQMMAGSE